MPANQHLEPAEEEDISRAGVYQDDPALNHPSTAGRKGKQSAENPFDDEDDEAGESSDEEYHAEKTYPPINDEEAESRRVAEVRSPHYALKQVY